MCSECSDKTHASAQASAFSSNSPFNIFLALFFRDVPDHWLLIIRNSSTHDFSEFCTRLCQGEFRGTRDPLKLYVGSSFFELKESSLYGQPLLVRRSCTLSL